MTNKDILNTLYITDSINDSILKEIEICLHDNRSYHNIVKQYFESDKVWSLKETVKYTNKIMQIIESSYKKEFLSLIISIEISTPFINFSKSLYNTLIINKQALVRNITSIDIIGQLRRDMNSLFVDNSKEFNIIYRDWFLESLMKNMMTLWEREISSLWGLDIRPYIRLNKRRYLGIKIETKELYLLKSGDLFKVNGLGSLEHLQEVFLRTDNNEFDWYGTYEIGSFRLSDIDVFLRN